MKILERVNVKFLSLVLVLLLLTLGLRLYKLGEHSFVADEFLDMNGSYGYMKTGNWAAWDFNFGEPSTVNLNEARDERATVYKWQVAQVLKYVEPTEENARLVSVFWGAVSLLVVVFAAWFFTGSKRIALIAGFLFAVSVSAIIFDRRLRMYAMFYPLYLLASVFLFGTLERVYQGRNKLLSWFQEKTGYHLVYGVLFVATVLLSLLTHQLTATILFTLVAYVLLQAFLTKRRGGRGWNVYTQTLALIGGVIVISLLFLPQVVSSFASNLIWLDDHYSYLGHFFNDFQHPLHAVLIVIASLYFFFRRGEGKQGAFLALSAFVPLVLAIWFWRRNVGPQYIFFAQSFLLILAANAVVGISEFLHRAMRETKFLTEKFLPHVRNTVIVIGLLILPHYSYFFHDENAYNQPAASSETHYRKLFTVFNKDSKKGEVLVTRNFRNYYFSGKGVEVYDFGGEMSEKKLQKEELDVLKTKYPHGWVVLSENDFDYISTEAEQYLESDAFQKVRHTNVKGGNAIYRW